MTPRNVTPGLVLLVLAWALGFAAVVFVIMAIWATGTEVPPRLGATAAVLGFLSAGCGAGATEIMR